MGQPVAFFLKVFITCFLFFTKNSKKCIPPFIPNATSFLWFIIILHICYCFLFFQYQVHKYVYPVGNINFREQTDFSFIVKNINRHPVNLVISVSTRYFRIYYMFFVLILTIFNSAILYQIKTGLKLTQAFTLCNSCIIRFCVKYYISYYFDLLSHIFKTILKYVIFLFEGKTNQSEAKASDQKYLNTHNSS